MLRKLMHQWPLVLTLVSLLLLSCGRTLALCAQSQCRQYQAWGWQKDVTFICAGYCLDEKFTKPSDTCQFCGNLWCDNPNIDQECTEFKTEFVYESACHPNHCKLLCPERLGTDVQEAYCTKPLDETSKKVNRHKCTVPAS